MIAARKTVRSRYVDGAPHQLLSPSPWHDDALKAASAFLFDRLVR